MGMSVLPDMYTRIPWATGLKDEGIHIRQNMSAHVATIMYHFNRAWVNTSSNPRQSLHLYRDSLDLIMVFNFKYYNAFPFIQILVGLYCGFVSKMFCDAIF